MGEGSPLIHLQRSAPPHGHFIFIADYLEGPEETEIKGTELLFSQ